MVMGNRAAEGTSMADVVGGTQVGDRTAQPDEMSDLQNPSLTSSFRNLLEHMCIVDGSSAPPFCLDSP